MNVMHNSKIGLLKCDKYKEKGNEMSFTMRT